MLEEKASNRGEYGDGDTGTVLAQGVFAIGGSGRLGQGRTPMKQGVVLTLLVMAIGLSTPAAMAQGSPERSWQNNVFLYGWAAGITGTGRLGQVEKPIDIEFSDILDTLEGAFYARYRGASKRFAVVADLEYLDLAKSSAGALLVRRVDLRDLVVDVTGAYRFSPVVEAFAGVRVSDMKTGLQLIPPSSLPGSTVERSGSKTFYDPIVGARLLTPLGNARRWWVQAQGDIGGFGVGTKFTWQATGNIGFRIVDWFSLWGGYRALGTKIENLGSLEQYSQDTVTHGLSFGLGFHF